MEKGKQKTHICCRNSRFPSYHSTIILIFLTQFCFENLQTMAAKMFWRPSHPQSIFIMYFLLVFMKMYWCKTSQYCRTAQLDEVLSLILSKETPWATRADLENWTRNLPADRQTNHLSTATAAPAMLHPYHLDTLGSNVKRRHWGILLY